MCISLLRQCTKQIIRDMHKSQIALGERWKWHFQASRFQNFQTPLAARASGARVPPPHLYYPCYGTALLEQ